MAAPLDPGPHPTEPCPSWCRRAHHVGDHPDDRHHQSLVHLVAVVTGHPTLEADDTSLAISVAVRLVSRAGSALTWLEVRSEEGPQVRLALTTESARHLLMTAGGLLDAATR
jgi:hypothetical protein